MQRVAESPGRGRVDGIRWNLVLPLVAFALAALLAAPAPVTAQTATLRGTVRAEGSLEPVPYASVQITQLQKGVLANDRGYFVLSGLPAGGHLLQAGSLGYQTTSRQIQLAAGAVETLEILLPEAPVEVQGIEVQSTRDDGITAGPGAQQARGDP